MAIPRTYFLPFKPFSEYEIFGDKDEDTYFRIRVNYGQVWSKANEEREGIDTAIDAYVGDVANYQLEVFPTRKETIGFFAERMGAINPSDNDLQGLRETGWPVFPNRFGKPWNSSAEAAVHNVLEQIDCFYCGRVSEEVKSRAAEYLRTMLSEEKIKQARQRCDERGGGLAM